MSKINMSDKDLFDMVRRVAKVACANQRAYDLCDDLTQEIFLMMPDIEAKWDPSKGAIDGYLYGFAVNILRNMLSQNSRLVLVEDDGYADSADEEVYEAPDLDARLDMQNAISRIAEKLARHGLSTVDFTPFEKRAKTYRQNPSEPNVLDHMLTRAGIPKAQVAKRLGISPQLLNAYIKGKTRTVPREIVEQIIELVYAHEQEVAR